MSKPTESQLNLIKSWRDDPQWSHNPDHVERWEKVLAIWGENSQDVPPFTKQDVAFYASKGWSRWQTIFNLLSSTETHQNEAKQEPLNVETTTVQSEPEEPIISEVSTRIIKVLDPRGDNDPWRFLTAQEKHRLEEKLDEAYQEDNPEKAKDLLLILEEQPPADHFSPSFVRNKARFDGNGLIEKAIKDAQEGKRWDDYWIRASHTNDYGLQDEVLKEQHDRVVESRIGSRAVTKR